ncbi:MAG: hypothetical protein ACI4DV_01745, partial [Lachnospiraceae bacterium]
MEDFLINKVHILTQGILGFPSLFLEGAAACGKSAAIAMLLSEHPEVTGIILCPADMDPECFGLKLEEVQSRMREEPVWLILEDLPGRLPAKMTQSIRRLIETLPESGRVILVSREKPETAFLELLWKRKMTLISQASLLFSKEETCQYAEQMESPLNTGELYEQTGGWPGCVDLMVRMSLDPVHAERSAASLRRSYEIDGYIRNEILGSLSEMEQELVHCAALCPWLNVRLCEEVWCMDAAGTVLEDLTRKGLLKYNENHVRWSLAPLLRHGQSTSGKLHKNEPSDLWKCLGEWYESGGFLREALECYEKSGESSCYRDCVVKHYREVPGLGVSYGAVMNERVNIPQLCYLRGMYCCSHQDFKGLAKEIAGLEKRKDSDPLSKEVLLNLKFASPEVSLEDWLEQLEKELPQKFSLYDILGRSHTCLCGLRDLTGLFACRKKEENRRAKIWREGLGEQEWKCYLLARIDYYLETERADAVSEEEWQMVRKAGDIAGFYLLNKLQRLRPDKERLYLIEALEEQLGSEADRKLAKTAEAVGCLYASWQQKRPRTLHWLR